MKYLPVLAALVMTVGLSYAQPRQSVNYYKHNGRRVELRDSADYVQIVSRDTSSALLSVNEYYLNGQLRFAGKSVSGFGASNLQGEAVGYFANGTTKFKAVYDKNKITGIKTLYFPNGKVYAEFDYSLKDKDITPDDFDAQIYLIKSSYDSLGKALVQNGNGHFVKYDAEFKFVNEEGEVKDGKREGTWKIETPDGSVRLTEVYTNGLLQQGLARFSNGTESRYTIAREIPPQYSGGLNGFYRFLGQVVRYPAQDRANGVQGRVVTSFVVERDGTLADIKVVHSVSTGIDAEAVHALQQSPKWQPGVQYGKPVRVQYSVPIVFSLGR